MERCSILLPGISELLALSHASTIEDGAYQLFKNPILKIIALKHGSKWCTIITREERFDLPPIIPLDATGAGDASDAGFICSYLDRKSLKKCARIASAAAALNTAAFGPMEGDITAENILTLMNKVSKNSMLKPITVERIHNADEST
jgi:sugar/nucleoside kinase (ribokinase family)